MRRKILILLTVILFIFSNNVVFADTSSAGSDVNAVIQSVKQLSVDPSALNLDIDERSCPITLNATYADDVTDDVTELATWTSSDSNVAKVDIDEGIVTVTGVTKGSAIITGGYEGKKVTIIVKVQAEMVDLMFQPESIKVVKGKTQAVKIYAVYSDDSNEDVTKLVKLESDDKGIATITRGKIKGIATGETIVRATYGNQSTEIDVKVTPSVKKLSVDPTDLILDIDEQSEPIELTAAFIDGSEDDVTTAALWTSTKSKVATIVVEDGVVTVTGVTKGTSLITGRFGGKKVTFRVNVEN